MSRPLRIEYEGGRYEGRAVMAAVANAPCFGGGMRVAPTAVLDDGRLDLVIVGDVTRPDLLRSLPRIYRGRHLDHPAVHTVQVRHAVIHSDPALRLHGDGEPVGRAGAGGTRIDVWPRALSVLA